MLGYINDRKYGLINLLNSKNTPRTIESSFRKELGDINPKICLIDIALSFFDSNLENSDNRSKFLRKLTAIHGHQGLYTDHLNFSDSRHVAYIAMIALIQSKADYFCTKIQNHPCLDKELKSHAKGDFLRKTIFIFLKSSFPERNPSNPVKSVDFEGLIDNNDILLIDYYRTIRNEELHNSSRTKQYDTLQKLFDKIDIDKTREFFKNIPNKPDSINFDDIILFSKVWQKIAKDIAKSFINFEEHVVVYIKKSFGNLNQKRKGNAVKQFLRKEFLLSDTEIIQLVDGLWAG